MTPATDIIFIQGLKTLATIGVYDWEKQFQQPLIFDLELGTDLRQAAQSDDLDDTVDYKRISDDILAWVGASDHDLIETLAESVCQQIFAQHSAVQSIQLTLKKPNAVNEADTVGLKLFRTRP